MRPCAILVVFLALCPLQFECLRLPYSSVQVKASERKHKVLPRKCLWEEVQVPSDFLEQEELCEVQRAAGNTTVSCNEDAIDAINNYHDQDKAADWVPDRITYMAKFGCRIGQINRFTHTAGECLHGDTAHEVLKRWSPISRQYSEAQTFLDVLHALTSSNVNRIVFIGDSTVEHLFQAAMCDIVRHAPLEDLAQMEHLLETETECQRDGEMIVPEWEKPSDLQPRQQKHFGGCAQQLKMIGGISPKRKDVWNLAGKSGPIDMFLVKRGYFTPGDRQELHDLLLKELPKEGSGFAVFAGIAFHLHSDEAVRANMPVLLDVLEEVGNKPNHFSFFREQSATHFTTATGRYNDEVASNATADLWNECVGDVSDHMSVNAYKMNILKSLMQERHIDHVSYIPFWQATSTRGQLHFNKGDCTHYCYTPFLYEPIWVHMLGTLGELGWDKYDFSEDCESSS